MGCTESKQKKGNNTQNDKNSVSNNNNNNTNNANNTNKNQKNLVIDLVVKDEGEDADQNQKNGIFDAQTPAERRQLENVNKEGGETASTDNLKLFYKLNKLRGTGSFGQVRDANSRTEQSRRFAVKTIAKERMGEKAYMLRRELEILKTLDHPNAIKFYEIFHDEQFIHFVMEYCNGGDLYNQITKNGPFKEQEAASIMQKIFSALAHMHSKDVIHRDLKPENLLFSSRKEDAEIKIIDFGLSRIFQPQHLPALPSVVGTPLYVAPEVIEETFYGKQCDNWSLGVVTFFILCGKEPFYARSIGEVYKKIRTADFSFQGEQWDSISNEAKDMIRGLLVVDPKKRMTAEQALQHSWFKTQIKYNSLNTLEVKKHQVFLKNILDNNWHRPILKLKKEVIKIILNHYLTDKEIETLNKVFRMLDQDKNGELSYEEMQSAMNIVEMGKDEQQQMKQAFINIHKNEDKMGSQKDIGNKKVVIYQSEFMCAAINMKQYLNKENLTGLFQFFDRSNSTLIKLDDIKEVVAREGRKLQQTELEEIMSEICMEKRGTISYALFEIMMLEDDIAKVQSSSIQMQKVKSTIQKQNQTNDNNNKLQ